MKLPFTSAQFLEVFEYYNLSVWPAQIALYALAIVMVILLWRRSKYSSRLISGILAIYWIWMGAIYHLTFFRTINKAAIPFGVIFILQGILFVYFGIIRKRISFMWNKDIYGLFGGLCILYGLIIYPVTGYLMGHVYPAAPTFGLPCPTTILT